MFVIMSQMEIFWDGNQDQKAKNFVGYLIFICHVFAAGLYPFYR